MLLSEGSRPTAPSTTTLDHRSVHRRSRQFALPAPTGTTSYIDNPSGSRNLHDDDDDDDDDEKDQHYNSSSLEIPKLRESMTPWRIANIEKRQSASQLDNPFGFLSPTTSKPSARNSLFSADGAATTIPTSAGSLEIDQLRKQVTTYKLKVRTLFELIKQLNYGDDGLDKNRDSFYHKLLSTISQNDEIDELRKQLNDLEISNDLKEKELVQLKGNLEKVNAELVDIKNEHLATLDYANEYLEHSEQISANVDEMLSILLTKLYRISPEEKDALEKAKKISSTFVMVKMNALIATLKKILDDLRELQQRNETDTYAMANSTLLRSDNDFNDDNSDAVNKSVIDTRLEEAIDEIHENYDNFIQGIKNKVDQSGKLEEILLNKLSQQQKLIQKVSSIYAKNAVSEKSNQVSENRIYEETVTKLNKKILELNNMINSKEGEILKLYNKLESTKSHKLTEERLRQSLNDEKELYHLKEKNWNKLTNDLEDDIEKAQASKNKLLDIVEHLNLDLDTLSKNSENKISKLEGQIEDITVKYNSINKEYQEIHVGYKTLLHKMELLKNDNNQLRQITTDFKNDSQLIEKNEAEFDKFKQHLLLHLSNLFDTLRKILQQNSIDQSERKLNSINNLQGLSQIKYMQPRLESLYNFVETALESIVESYMTVLLTEKNDMDDGSRRVQGIKELELRVEELERKWISERERRKLDSNASESRIQKLEEENESLRKQLYNMPVNE